MPFVVPDGIPHRVAERSARWRAAPALHPHGVLCSGTPDVLDLLFTSSGSGRLGRRPSTAGGAGRHTFGVPSRP